MNNICCRASFECESQQIKKWGCHQKLKHPLLLCTWEGTCNQQTQEKVVIHVNNRFKMMKIGKCYKGE
jgi:hypothetical protein